MAFFKDEKRKTERPADNKRIVSFYLSKKEYAVPIRFIKEIIYFKEVNPLPGMSDPIEGVIDLRGVVVPVIGLRKRLKLPSVEPVSSEHILIVEIRKRKWGFIVDRVLEVMSVKENQIQATEDFMDHRIPYLEGICRLEDRLILLLDLEHLWTEAEMVQIESTFTPSVQTQVDLSKDTSQP